MIFATKTTDLDEKLAIDGFSDRVNDFTIIDINASRKHLQQFQHSHLDLYLAYDDFGKVTYSFNQNDSDSNFDNFC